MSTFNKVLVCLNIACGVANLYLGSPGVAIFCFGVAALIMFFDHATGKK